MGVVSAVALRTVVASKDDVIDANSPRLVLRGADLDAARTKGKPTAPSADSAIRSSDRPHVGARRLRPDRRAVAAARETDEGRRAVDAIVQPRPNTAKRHRPGRGDAQGLRRHGQPCVRRLKRSRRAERVAMHNAISDFITRENSTAGSGATKSPPTPRTLAVNSDRRHGHGPRLILAAIVPPSICRAPLDPADRHGRRPGAELVGRAAGRRQPAGRRAPRNRRPR